MERRHLLPTPAGTTANAVSSLSLDPPLLLACLDASSHTLEAIRTHGAFALNVLAEAHEELSANFARRGPGASWDGMPHQPGLTGESHGDSPLAVMNRPVDISSAATDSPTWRGRKTVTPSTCGRSRAPLDYRPGQDHGPPVAEIHPQHPRGIAV